ncbi:MAG: Maf family protein [Candidatus Margulisiibacteriota bacterium]
MPTKFILASASPRRKALLKKIIKNFRVVNSGIDESALKATSPVGYAQKAARIKAQAVAARHKDAVVIGADTIVVLGKHILGKPKNSADALRMLKNLAGKTHQVITALTVFFPNGKSISRITRTKIKTNQISDQVIRTYVSSGRPLDKAGAYGIQEIEELFVEKIKGDYDNVVGLPVKTLQRMLKSAHV